MQRRNLPHLGRWRAGARFWGYKMTETSGPTGRRVMIVLGCVLIAACGGGLYYVFFEHPGRGELAAVVGTSEPADQADTNTTTAVQTQPDTGESTDAVAAPETTSAEPATSDPAEKTAERANAETAETAETAAVKEAPSAPEPTAPAVDIARVEPDGSALIAGSAEPGAEVIVRLDGEEVGRTTAGADGKFAAFLDLDLGSAPRLLTLMSEVDGQELASTDRLILAPTTLATNETDNRPDSGSAAPVAGDAQGSSGENGSDDGEATTTTAEAETSRDTPADDDASTEVAIAENAQTNNPASEPTASEEATSAAGQPDASAAPGEGASQDTTEQVATALPTPSETASTETGGTQTAAPATADVNPAPVAIPTTTTDTVTAETVPAIEPKVEEQTASVEASTASESATASTSTTEQNAAVDTENAEGNPVSAVPVVEAPSGAVAVLRAGSDGIELLQPAIPERSDAMTTMALDTISYSAAGDVQLSGRARDSSVVRVYLDNRAVADIDTDTQGSWRGELQDIRPGVYTLRLDELTREGRVLSRVETPFKREPPAVLNPPARDNSETGAPQPPIRAVTVQQGDTLWAISEDRYGEGTLYVRVFEANRDSIRDPDLIYPGQIFTIPD